MINVFMAFCRKGKLFLLYTIEWLGEGKEKEARDWDVMKEKETSDQLNLIACKRFIMSFYDRHFNINYSIRHVWSRRAGSETARRAYLDKKFMFSLNWQQTTKTATTAIRNRLICFSPLSLAHSIDQICMSMSILGNAHTYKYIYIRL